MSIQANLGNIITHKFIKPALESPQLESNARYLGYDIGENFHEDDFKKFNHQLFKNHIAPLILTYINSEEAKQLDSRASSLDVTATFEPILEGYPRKICKLIPGRWDDYGPPDYALWNWVASHYPFNRWFTQM